MRSFKIVLLSLFVAVLIAMSFVAGQYVVLRAMLANNTIHEIATLAGFTAVVKRTHCMELPTRADELRSYLEQQVRLLELQSSEIDEMSIWDAIPPSSIRYLLQGRNEVVSIQDIREKIRSIGLC